MLIKHSQTNLQKTVPICLLVSLLVESCLLNSVKTQKYETDNIHNYRKVAKLKTLVKFSHSRNQ